jgi:uncharacterized protein (TIGR00255 family)
MLSSMTGFGVGRAVSGDEELLVELKSLNHKFCEVKVRLPRELSSLEASVIKRIKDRLARGSVDVFVRRTTVGRSASVPQVDAALAREYARALSEVARAAGLDERPRLQDVALQPGVIRLEERGVNVEQAERALDAALGQSLEALQSMRKVEGAAIEADLRARVAWVERVAAEIRELSPRLVQDVRARLQARITELLEGGTVDPQRLAQEVAFHAERTDISEEMTRLQAHVDQFRQLLGQNEPAGRKLDFLVQEMNREVNTTGSKSQSPAISERVVALKAEIERIREQVQNVE